MFKPSISMHVVYSNEKAMDHESDYFISEAQFKKVVSMPVHTGRIYALILK